MFVSEDMTNIAKIPGEVMKTEANGRLFCSALQFALLYKAPVSEKQKTEPIPGKLWVSVSQKVKRVRV